MRVMSRLWYALFLVSAIILMDGCNSSSSDSTPASESEQYPDIANEPNATTPAIEGDALKNTSSFHTVEIKQMKFQPSELKLHMGDTVLWINKDITDHDITEESNKAWASSRLPMGTSWTKVVTESADYYCSIHVVMKGKLIVE